MNKHEQASRSTRRTTRAAAALMTLALVTSSGLAQKSWNTSDGFWSNPSNWTGGLPGFADDVFIGNLFAAENSEVSFDVNAVISSLSITDGMKLDTDGRVLLVNGDISVMGVNAVNGEGIFNSQLRVESTGSALPGVTAQNLTLGDSAFLSTNLGSHLRLHDSLRLLPSGGQVQSRGLIELTTGGVGLVNDGSIIAFSGDSRIEAQDALVDLDGVAGDGILSASLLSSVGNSWGHTVIARGMTDDFNGTMIVDGPNFIELEFQEEWTLGSGGELRFGAAAPQFPGTTDFRSTPFRSEGLIRSTSNDTEVFADVTFAPQSELLVGNDTLAFRGTTVIEGGTFGIGLGAFLVFAGSGDTVLVDGDFQQELNGRVAFENLVLAGGADFDGEVIMHKGARVVSDSVINADVLSTGFGGNATGDVWDLKADLVVNTGFIGNFAGNQEQVVYDNISIGRNGLNAATWTVNLPEGESYEIAGDVEIDHFEFGGGTASIAGSDVRISGDIDVNGFTRFDARTEFVDNFVTLDNGELRLAGGSIDEPNILDSVFIINTGGDIDSPFTADEGVGVEGSGIIQTYTDFAPGSSLIATSTENGDSLFVATITSAGTLGVRGENARLVITGADGYDTSTGEHFVLEDGSVRGNRILNTNETGIRGYGDIAIGVINDSIIAAEGGRLVVDNSIDAFQFVTQANDLDGANNQGRLHAVDGSLTIVGETGTFAGEVRVSGAHDLTLSDSEFTFTPGSLIDMTGGRIVSDELQTLSGQLRTAVSSARFDTDAVFTPQSSAFLASGLVLTGDTAVREGAVFAGDAVLTNAASGLLTLSDGASLGVDVTSNGVIELGDKIIDDAIGDAALEHGLFLTGLLAIDLAGDTEPLYDQLAIAETLTVRDAAFDVAFSAGFEAQAGDEFDVLDFAAFNNLGYTLHLPDLAPGLLWDSSDFETLGVIRVQIPTPGTAVLTVMAALGLTRRRSAQERSS